MIYLLDLMVLKIYWLIYKNKGMKNTISFSHEMKKGMLDDDYTLYDSGEILHEYDKSAYPGGQNLSETLSPGQIHDDIKERLLNTASSENKALVRSLLGMSE